jgi:hypothetical protein
VKARYLIETPFACDMTAIAPAERAAHAALAARLFGELAVETREQPDAYVFRFAAERFAEVARFVDNERRCCPFFAFDLSVAPHGGPLALRIGGPEGVKAFIRAELGL